MLTLSQLKNGSYDIIHCGDVVANVNTFSQSFTVVESEWKYLTPEQQEEVKALVRNILRGRHHESSDQKDD